MKALELLGRHLALFSDQVTLKGDAENPFVAIIRRAQGNALMPIAQRSEGDNADILEGEIVEREDAAPSDTPAQAMASDNALEAFNSIDDSDEDEGDDAPVVEATPANEAPQEDEALKRKDDFVLWRGGRRRNV